MKPDKNETEENDDVRMEVIQKFYMGSPSTSPRAMGPSINSEAFLFLKKFFHRNTKKSEKSNT